MKDISNLESDLLKIESRLKKNLLRATQDTIETIWDDVILRAPSNSGEYVSSIQIKNASIENNEIKARVFTDMLTEPTEEEPNRFYIGRMIENGTGIYALEPHIGHTKTFKESGYNYWFVPAKSVSRAVGRKIIINGNEFYIAHAQPAHPHFMPALQMNETTFKQNIRNAIKESFNL